MSTTAPGQMPPRSWVQQITGMPVSVLARGVGARSDVAGSAAQDVAGRTAPARCGPLDASAAGRARRIRGRALLDDGHGLDDGDGHVSNDVLTMLDRVDGPAVLTPYGLVQVRIFETEVRLVWAKAVDYPRTTAVDRTVDEDAVPPVVGWTLLEEGADIDTSRGDPHVAGVHEVTAGHPR